MAEIPLPGGRTLDLAKKCPKCKARGREAGMDAWGCVKCNNTKRLENPAWEYVQSRPYDDLSVGYGRPRRASFDFKTPDLTDYRRQVTSRWTWAIPDPDTLQFIVDTLNGRPVVEMGAGNGYWAWMLSQLGVDVKAYDLHPVGTEDSWYTDKHLAEARWPADFEPQEFFPVEQGGPEVLLDFDPDRVLFLCWPTYDTDFAYEALEAFQGDTVIYIGEGESGCTANWKFFALTQEHDPEWPLWGMPEGATRPEQKWERVTEHFIEQWFGINDVVTVYRRKQ